MQFMHGGAEAHNCAPVYYMASIHAAQCPPSTYAAHPRQYDMLPNAHRQYMLPNLVRAGRTSIVPGKELLSHLTSAGTKEELGRLGEKFVADIEAGRHKQEGWPSSMYGISKLLLSMYTRIEAREMEGRGIMVNACCPGCVNGGLSRGASSLSPALVQHTFA